MDGAISGTHGFYLQILWIWFYWKVSYHPNLGICRCHIKSCKYRCFWYLGVAQNLCFTIFFLFIVQYQTYTRPFLDDVWVPISGNPDTETCHGWWINFPMLQTKRHDELARTNYLLQATTQVQCERNHIQAAPCKIYEMPPSTGTCSHLFPIWKGIPSTRHPASPCAMLGHCQ